MKSWNFFIALSSSCRLQWVVLGDVNLQSLFCPYLQIIPVLSLSPLGELSHLVYGRGDVQVAQYYLQSLNRLAGYTGTVIQSTAIMNSREANRQPFPTPVLTWTLSVTFSPCTTLQFIPSYYWSITGRPGCRLLWLLIWTSGELYVWTLYPGSIGRKKKRPMK